ncbi:MAG TPA: hypothetical protein VKF37_08650 [Chloroflexota bacterium]|nr:hypothetical protein [Chloroflexota bacterium]
MATDAQKETTEVAPASHAAALLEARARLWLNDVQAARRGVHEATEKALALCDGQPTGARVTVNGNDLLSAICALLDTVHDRLDEVEDIVCAVPSAVEEEAEARLQMLVQEALLLQAAMAPGAPQA